MLLKLHCEFFFRRWCCRCLQLQEDPILVSFPCSSRRRRYHDLYSRIKLIHSRLDSSGNQYCYLAISPSKTNSISIWGDAIMRAGYFVFDLDNGQISLGQAKYSDESQIVAVEAGPHGLASAINQPQYAQTTQTYPPAPFGTALSRKASVSMANLTIGAATTSAAANIGILGSDRPISVPVLWSNSPAPLQILFLSPEYLSCSHEHHSEYRSCCLKHHIKYSLTCLEHR
jgi:hypothetical protein